MKKKFVGCYNPSVILTYIGLASSIISIYLAYHYIFSWSLFCLMFSGLCDMFDGTIARRIKRTEQAKKFGIQIDSLCDLVCFGVTPSFLGIALYKKGNLEFLGVVAGICLTLAAVIRLAFFNVVEEERQQNTTERRHSYQGLPVTNSSIIAPFAYCIGSLVSRELVLPVLYSIALMVTAFLFILNFKVPKIYGKANYVIIGLALALFIAVLLV
ncbi:MAG: CDP-alcohol phosphatidyltransferase family protein [Lachnospiraceae bacterium]